MRGLRFVSGLCCFRTRDSAKSAPPPPEESRPLLASLPTTPAPAGSSSAMGITPSSPVASEPRSQTQSPSPAPAEPTLVVQDENAPPQELAQEPRSESLPSAAGQAETVPGVTHTTSPSLVPEQTEPAKGKASNRRRQKSRKTKGLEHMFQTNPMVVPELRSQAQPQQPSETQAAIQVSVQTSPDADPVVTQPRRKLPFEGLGNYPDKRLNRPRPEESGRPTLDQTPTAQASGQILETNVSKDSPMDTLPGSTSTETRSVSSSKLTDPESARPIPAKPKPATALAHNTVGNPASSGEKWLPVTKKDIPLRKRKNRKNAAGNRPPPEDIWGEYTPQQLFPTHFGLDPAKVVMPSKRKAAEGSLLKDETKD